VRDKIKKYLIYLFAIDENFSLENRLFLSAIITAIFVSFFGFVSSLIIEISMTVTLVSISFFFPLILLYYNVRKNRNFDLFKIPMIFISFIGIALVWIFGGGIDGPNLLIGIVVFILSLVVVSDKNKKYVISLFIALLISIYLIQFFRPGLITDFSSETARWIDGLVTAIFSSFFIFLIIKFLHKNYTLENQRAEESKIKFRALSENSQDSIIRIDRQHRLNYINKAVIEMAGLTIEKIKGKTIKEIGIYNQKQSEKFEKIVENVFVTKEPQIEHFNIERGNNTIYYQWRLFPELNDKNEIVSVLGVSRDITTLKQSEKNLLQLNADKDHFLSILAHDLKGPLGSIVGVLNNFEANVREYDINEIEKRIKILNFSANRVYHLLEDMLEWGTIKSGKFQFEPKELIFESICNEVIENLKLTANNKNITIHFFTEEKLSIHADKNMLFTILNNLVSNAIKFSNPGGQIKIFAEKNHSKVLITVSDNGIGIESGRLKTLFDITQIQTTLGTEEEKGTGLGLLICKEFVEKHNEKIWVESKVGQGSSFKFTIPLFNK